MDLEQIITLIHEHGLSKYQDDILASVRPAILLKLGQAEAGHKGQSRIGGVPDLPLSVPWPKNTPSDSYLCFILQINLAELPTFAENPLTKRGMLYLFASESENAAEQLVFYDGSESLEPAKLPEDTRLITDWYDNLVTHRLEFELFPDIPRWATNDFYRLCAHLNLDELKLNDLCRTLSENSVGKLLGHASGIGHDPREDAYVVRQVNPEWLYNYEQRQTLDMTHAQNWHNLLEVESNRKVDLMFGDAGYLQVLIHGEDLKRLDFSQVYVNLESS
ncbi:YwqG family protein [Nostoc sp. ChiQUE01b]|uniref:YwqG family protein n=1 Tax=Nostoc sp. ChiQUE01b TaxID=3075376 RepID=UPI002AD540B5|nr:YwqG family protein [Nostoc sp. ChiQUE01b]MDZ8262974.1 YwqG family protein [Nostoc sp. ChiQUE01b]